MLPNLLQALPSLLVLDMIALAPHVSRPTAQEIAASVERHCNPSHKELVLAIAFVESSFRPNVVNIGGDYGLFQYSRKYGPSRLALRTIDAQVAYFCADLRRYQSTYGETHPLTWFAFHHSGTPEHHLAYANRVQRTINKMKGQDNDTR